MGVKGKGLWGSRCRSGGGGMRFVGSGFFQEGAQGSSETENSFAHSATAISSLAKTPNTRRPDALLHQSLSAQPL